MAYQKKYVVKILAKNGTDILKNIPHGSIRSAPTFPSRINGGLGECVIDYKAPFDNFGEGTIVEVGNVLEVWAHDSSYPLGRRIYSGTIQEYEPYIAGAKEGVLIKALGFASNLTFDIHMSAVRSSYAVTYTTLDPEAIFKAIIDEYRAGVNNPLINYGVGSTSPVGTLITQTYTDKTWFDCIEDIRTKAGTGWWWSVDADGLASLLPKPTNATHLFVLGKHIESGRFPKSGKGIKNKIRVTRSGGTVTEYVDATSKAAYEQRIKIVSASDVGDANGADQKGNTELGNNKDKKAKHSLIINEKYDLESIKVGQTCNVLRVLNGSALFVTNMQIVGLTYSGNRVSLELDEQSADLGLALDKFVNG